MLNKLQMLCKEHKFVSLHTNPNDSSKFIFGKLMCVNNDEYALYMISPNGDYDGIVIKQINDILYMEIESQYINKMIKLYSLDLLPGQDVIFDEANIKVSMLNHATNTKKIVSLEINYSGCDDIVGYVKNINQTLCQIQQLDSYGKEDGYAFVEIDNITQISYDSKDEQRIGQKTQITQEQ